MPHFYYKAITRDGVTDEGEMVEANSAAVIRRLQDGGFIPILTEEIAPGKVKRGGLRLPNLRRKAAQPDIVAFTRSLTSLLGSGTALDRALNIMLEVEAEPATRALIEDVQIAVRGGASLSQAFDDQGRVFSGFYVSMVRAAEASGTLSDGLERMLEYLERSRELREKIVSALIYPIILFVVAGLSVLILLTLVVPQFRPIFEEMGAALPLATRVVLAISDFFASYWWLVAIVIAGVALGIWQILEDPDKRRQLDAMSLRLPLLGPLISANETARFSRSLGTLLQNGVPVLQGLEIGRNTLTNRALAAAVDDASASLKGGAVPAFGSPA